MRHRGRLSRNVLTEFVLSRHRVPATHVTDDDIHHVSSLEILETNLLKQLVQVIIVVVGRPADTDTMAPVGKSACDQECYHILSARRRM